MLDTIAIVAPSSATSFCFCTTCIYKESHSPLKIVTHPTSLPLCREDFRRDQVIDAREGMRDGAKSRLGGHVADASAVEIDLAIVLQRCKVFSPGPKRHLLLRESAPDTSLLPDDYRQREFTLTDKN